MSPLAQRPSGMTQHPAIRVHDVSKAYSEEGGETVLALDAVGLDIPPQSFVSFVGPSGCGKTTLLKLIAGIEQPSSGSILSLERPLSSINRDVAYVPQGRGLFPWMTLQQNVEFPLKLAGVPRAVRAEKARAWIDRVELGGFENSFPRQLSGGMEKRGSLARALVADRRILLMDEPFGPLDAQTRLTLQQHLMRLWGEIRSTVVFVTHDVVEAIAMSDLIVVFAPRPGRIIDVVPVTLPRPRDVFSVYEYDGFSGLHQHLQRLLRRET